MRFSRLKNLIWIEDFRGIRRQNTWTRFYTHIFSYNLEIRIKNHIENNIKITSRNKDEKIIY